MTECINHDMKKNDQISYSPKTLSLYLLFVMKSHPWIMQVGQMCVVTLCKINVKYLCYQMSNKCFVNLKMTI